MQKNPKYLKQFCRFYEYTIDVSKVTRWHESIMGLSMLIITLDRTELEVRWTHILLSHYYRPIWGDALIT